MIRRTVISSLVASYFVSVIAHAGNVVGVRGEVGCGENPKRVERLLMLLRCRMVSARRAQFVTPQN